MESAQRATRIHTSALLESVLSGNTGRVEAALEAGADINGYPELPYAPIMAAIAWDNVDMVKFLIELGADPDRPTDREVPLPNSDVAIMSGSRALHLAAKRGNVEIVSLLLKRARADPNATDQQGGAPLMAACTCVDNYVAVVRLMLEAGADPTLTDHGGFTAMHLVAQIGVNMDLVGMLYARAPATLNHYSTDGRTPLCLASARGHESMVSRLLSQGAMQQTPLDERKMCPLSAATTNGFVGVVRILIKNGVGVVGGTEAVAMALLCALSYRQAKILQLLLAADGEMTPIEWASALLNGKSLLHHGAGYCCPASVSVLLAAGANEAVRDTEGHLPRDAIGVDLGQKGAQMDRGEEVAVRRMLEQGPGYRARSWAWPTEEDGDDGGCGDGEAVLSSAPATPKAPPPVGVRIFRPNDGGRNFFVSLVGRYCEKN